jgi:hypothetical protein
MTVVIDLILFLCDEDDHSLSSVDSYYDCFKLGRNEQTLFARDKVSIVLTIDVDEDDVTMNSMTTDLQPLRQHYLESDSSYCSTLARRMILGIERRPWTVKKRQDLFARRYVSCRGVSQLASPSSSPRQSSSMVEAIFFPKVSDKSFSTYILTVDPTF